MLGKIFKKLSDHFNKPDSFPAILAVDNLKGGLTINTFDCDGVIQINDEIGGIYPGPHDMIITGRSYEEKPETDALFLKRGINNKIYYNQLPFNKKTRESSGKHKANTIKFLQKNGYKICAHFEDDPIQANIILEDCPNIKVIMIVHNLTELENIRHN